MREVEREKEKGRERETEEEGWVSYKQKVKFM